MVKQYKAGHEYPEKDVPQSSATLWLALVARVTRLGTDGEWKEALRSVSIDSETLSMKPHRSHVAAESKCKGVPR